MMHKLFTFLLSLPLLSCACCAETALNENWNPEVGLWWQEGPGHTFAVEGLEKVHTGRAAASRLLNAAVLDRLDELEVNRVLRALRQLQDVDPASETFGCMRWYAEDTHVDDTNAAFFMGLPLIVLHSVYADQIDQKGRLLLDDILVDLKHWFVASVKQHPRVYYPNKFLGDLVCAWMLLEITGDTEKMAWLADEMLQAAMYWSENEWGWGEHMSDSYARLCLDELSVLLCLANDLPEAVSKSYTGLMNELLSIEDRFGGSPRVPAIRSSAFTKSPVHENFRDKVRQWPAEELLEHKNSLNLGPILNQLSWSELVSDRGEQKAWIQINCFNNIQANAWVQDDVRIGSLTTFPVMPTAEHNGWGLAWQSFPVAMWRPEGDWAFLQWMVRQDNMLKAHPAVDWNSAYLNNALSTSISPPIVGRTYALQKKGNVLVLRIMPATDADWDAAIDQLRMIEGSVQAQALPQDGRWSQLLLDYGDRTISLSHLNLMEGRGPHMQPNHHNGFDWRVTWTSEDMKARPANELGKHMLVSLWGISLDGEIAESPELRPLKTVPMQRNAEQRAYILEWNWPGVTWHVEIDPLSVHPLVERTSAP